MRKCRGENAWSRNIKPGQAGLTGLRSIQLLLLYQLTDIPALVL
jgi:hypothetical protein